MEGDERAEFASMSRTHASLRALQALENWTVEQCRAALDGGGGEAYRRILDGEEP